MRKEDDRAAGMRTPEIDSMSHNFGVVAVAVKERDRGLHVVRDAQARNTTLYATQHNRPNSNNM